MKKVASAAMVAILVIGFCIIGGCAQRGEENILEELSTEQKIGQLFLIGFDGTALTPEIEDLFKTIHPGGVILYGRNINDADQLERLIKDLQDLSLDDTGLPLFVATDQEGGEVFRIGWLEDEIPESEIKDTGQAYQTGLERGRGLKNSGINLNLAPVLDIGEEGDFLEKYNRTFEGSPEEIGELGKGMISGQKDGGILSTAKHFPGYGGITFDPETEKIPVVPTIPEITQFQIAEEAEPEFIMTANVIYTEIDEGLPFTLSPEGIKFLKEAIEGDYLIISDDLATETLKEKYSLKKTVILAAKAGVDVLLISAHQPEDPLDAFNDLSEAVKNGEISEKEINDRVSKIIRLKQETSVSQ